MCFTLVSGLSQEIKADVLRHLCYFLSSSAATFKYPSPTSTEDISLSAVVREREVYINYDDLVALHGLLFRELAHHVPLFSADDGRFGESHSAFPSTLQGLKVAALTLRCCIRLLPLIELFDTGLRNAMGVGLDNFLQKLCSPWEPCLLPAKVCPLEAMTSNIEPYRAPMLCASLEVRLFSNDFISVIFSPHVRNLTIHCLKGIPYPLLISDENLICLIERMQYVSHTKFSTLSDGVHRLNIPRI